MGASGRALRAPFCLLLRRNHFDGPAIGSGHGRDGDTPVKCGEFSRPAPRKTQQIDVRQHLMSHWRSPSEKPLVAKRDLVWPEDVAAARAEFAEATDDRSPRLRAGHVGGVRENPHESVLGDRAGCPAILAVVAEPAVRSFVMYVIRIEQCDEDVDVEQCDVRHASSLSRLTRAIVGRALPFGLRGIRGTPLRTRGDLTGSSAFRASSERTRPAVVERLAAISFAACRTSSSISSVVLMSVSSRITHQMS